MTFSKRTLLAVAWGCALALWTTRGFFVHPVGQIHGSHEDYSYVYRLIEFRECLNAGYLSPQWCTNFRDGLGQPFFNYYQPGFFYCASVVPWSVPPVEALGITLWVFTLLGYTGTFTLGYRAFGLIGGVLSGTMLCLSVYSGTELYVRGDLSEYSAMMLFAALLSVAISCLEQPSRRNRAGISLMGAALVCVHPCIALAGFGMLTISAFVHLFITGRSANTLFMLCALGCGGGLAAFYWIPILLEWQFISPSAAFEGYFGYANHFVSPLRLFSVYSRQDMPLTLGLFTLLVLAVNTVRIGRIWQGLTSQQHRLILHLGLTLGLCVFMMVLPSRPIWDYAVPLQLLQFPWRFLTIATVVLSGLTGAFLLKMSTKVRLVACLFVTSVSWWNSASYTERLAPVTFAVFDEAAGIAEDSEFAPDISDEWMPRGAFRIVDPPRKPLGGSRVQVRDYSRATGRLSWSVTSGEGGRLILPHYYFPVGWSADLGGNSLELSPNEHGLMIVQIPPQSDGILEIRFSMTPARRLGWLVTAASVMVTAIWLMPIWWRRGSARAETAAR